MRASPLSLFYFSAFFKSQMFLLPVLYLFYLSNGLTAADYFLFQGIIVLVNVLLQLPVGYISDRMSRQKIVMLSYLLFLGRIGCWAFFEGKFIVFIGEILYAISKSMFDAVESPYIYDILKANNKTDRMTKAYGHLNFALGVGGAVAALTGAWLYETVGLHILLATEFVFISAAVYCVWRIPQVKASASQSIVRFSRKRMAYAFSYVFKKKIYAPFVLYSALIVACSHFFFWGFQPWMKWAGVPVALFGIVICVNNGMRALGSLNASRIMAWLSLRKAVVISFGLNCIGFFAFVLLQNQMSAWVCLVGIFYLCICIVMQLILTIAHTARLQQKVPTSIRGCVASVNMMMARFVTAIVLIVPKYCMETFSLVHLYSCYGMIFTVVGGWFVCRILSLKRL